MKYLEVEVDGAPEQAERRAMGNGASDERWMTEQATSDKRRDQAERRATEQATSDERRSKRRD